MSGWVVGRISPLAGAWRTEVEREKWTEYHETLTSTRRPRWDVDRSYAKRFARLEDATAFALVHDGWVEEW